MAKLDVAPHLAVDPAEVVKFREEYKSLSPEKKKEYRNQIRQEMNQVLDITTDFNADLSAVEGYENGKGADNQRRFIEQHCRLAALNEDIRVYNQERNRAIQIAARESMAFGGPVDEPEVREARLRSSSGSMSLLSSIHNAFRQQNEGRDLTDEDVKGLLSNGRVAEFKLAGYNPHGKFRNDTATTSTSFDPPTTRRGVVLPHIEEVKGSSVAFYRELDVEPWSEQAVLTMGTTKRVTTESTFDAAVGEIGAAAETDYVFGEMTEVMKRVAVLQPISERQLQTVDGFNAIINRKLERMIAEQLDKQIIGGNGSANQLNGLLRQRTFAGPGSVADVNVSVLDQDLTHSAGTTISNPVDTIFDAQLKIEDEGGADPNIVFIVSGLWALAAKQKTSDGAFLLGSAVEGFVPQIMGMRIVRTNRLTGLATTAANTVHAVVMDTAVAALYMLRAPTLRIGYNSDGFAKSVLSFKVEADAALVVDRPQGICTVTRP